jgi:dolichyl-phosphate beta-glucosyltransferase
VKVREYLNASRWDFAEIVVVDDGSVDHTVQLARDAGVRVLQNPGNRGKGYSVKHGMLEAKGEWALFTDADLSSPIGEVEKLWSALERERAQVAVGSRAVDRSLVGVHQPVLREAVGRVFNAAMRVVTGLPFKDTQCGFKLFETSVGREVFSRQQLDGFGFDVEVLFIAKQLGLKSVEVPVRWDNVEGTKVSVLLGFVAFLDLLKVRGNALQGKYK